MKMASGKPPFSWDSPKTSENTMEHTRAQSPRKGMKVLLLLCMWYLCCFVGQVAAESTSRAAVYTPNNPGSSYQPRSASSGPLATLAAQISRTQAHATAPQTALISDPGNVVKLSGLETPAGVALSPTAYKQLHTEASVVMRRGNVQDDGTCQCAPFGASQLPIDNNEWIGVISDFFIAVSAPLQTLFCSRAGCFVVT